MRVFVIPAKYTDEFEAGVARLAHEINLDDWRRRNGHTPILDDAFIEKGRKGSTFVVVGQANDSLKLGVDIARSKVAHVRQRSRSRKRA